MRRVARAFGARDFCLRTRKHPANELAGYHYPMPTALPCAVRHIIGVASRFNGWIFPNINTFPCACTLSVHGFPLHTPTRFPVAPSKTESRQRSVVGISFYPAWKAGRVERDNIPRNGFGASPPQTKRRLFLIRRLTHLEDGCFRRKLK